MTGRGRRIAVFLVVLAAVLSVGRWGSAFLAERLWEASVSEAVAVAGARRALLALALDLLVLLVSTGWFVANFTIAARVALPGLAPPEQEDARIWPAQIPRWSLTILAVVVGALLGTGGGGWLDHLLLTLDGVRLGLPDRLLGADLAVFVRDFPLLLELQSRVALLAGAGLAGVVLLHLTGGTLRRVNQRLWVSPRARGHLALLLAVLALALGWGAALEPLRLAAGLRGPLLPSEFLLRTLVAEVEAGLGAAAAVLSFLWWLKLRGIAAFGGWLLFLAALLAGRLLPLHNEAATADPGWQASARGIDSVAFALGAVEGPPPSIRPPAASLPLSLWDESVLQGAAADSAAISGFSRGWIRAGGLERPVWFAVREARGQPPKILALSDDRVSSSGGPLYWTEGDSTPSPEVRGYRDLSPHSIRPGARAIDLAPMAHGVALDGWGKRLVVAWAMQVPGALRAPAGTRIGWRLDPAVRLRTVASFARWSAPRLRLLGSRTVWQSDGLLTSPFFPASARVTWDGGEVSMVRPTFVGVVDVATGGVRLFRRDPADSLAAAWARITAPLIEAPAAIPAELRLEDAYPEELLLAQASALEGPAWRVGRLERSGAAAAPSSPSTIPGGGERLAAFTIDTNRIIRALLLGRRTSGGDSLNLIKLDSARAVGSGALLEHHWGDFPFLVALRDSIRATGASPELGQVRFLLAQEGAMGYQPEWAVSPSGRAQLVSVSIALGSKHGAGRTPAEAWMNLRGETAPRAGGTAAEVLEKARRWMQHADSALKRGDLEELGKALANLRELLGPPRDK